jgi:hypothetical protein
MALAELRRCREAAEWQRKIIAEAEQTKQIDLVAKLKAGLKRYDEGPPCRVVRETIKKGP